MKMKYRVKSKKTNLPYLFKIKAYPNKARQSMKEEEKERGGGRQI